MTPVPDPYPDPHVDGTPDGHPDPDAPWWRRASWRVLTDWRYPAALAAALLVASVLIAQLFVVRGYRAVLDDVDARTEAAECVDLLEEEFQRAISEVVIGLVQDDPEALERQVDALRLATDEAAVRACYALARP